MQTDNELKMWSYLCIQLSLDVRGGLYKRGFINTPVPIIGYDVISCTYQKYLAFLFLEVVLERLTSSG